MKLVNGRIILSRRNLLSLLHKLDDPDSQRTIFKNVLTEEGTIQTLIVSAQDDEAHYRDEAPGRMSPATEAFIRAHQQ